MTTNTAAKVAGHTEKEKVEKRRALGRGLESLLPRVVSTFKGGKDSGGPGAEPLRSKEESDAALKGRSSTAATTVELKPSDRVPNLAEQNHRPSTSSGEAFSQRGESPSTPLIGDVGRPQVSALPTTGHDLASAPPPDSFPTTNENQNPHP